MFVEEVIFTAEECREIINYSSEIENIYDSFEKEKTPGVVYVSYNISNDGKYKWVFDRILNFFVKKTDLEINQNPNIIHLHRYNKNCMFAKHHDKNESRRVWNVGVQLTNDYEGGELNLFYTNKITVDRRVGNCYIFRPEVFHEVTKVTEGTRWSLILFLFYENIREKLSDKTLF